MSSSCDFEASDSTSPWKTRKFRAFTRTPISFRAFSYLSRVTSCESNQYAPTPTAEIVLENTTMSLSRSYVSVTEAFLLDWDGPRCRSSINFELRKCLACNPST